MGFVRTLVEPGEPIKYNRADVVRLAQGGRREVSHARA
jgi:hypothetical protein